MNEMSNSGSFAAEKIKVIFKIDLATQKKSGSLKKKAIMTFGRAKELFFRHKKASYTYFRSKVMYTYVYVILKKRYIEMFLFQRYINIEQSYVFFISLRS